MSYLYGVQETPVAQDAAEVTLSWPEYAVGIAAVLGILGLFWRGWRRLRRNMVDPLTQMARDWRGEPGRPGYPPRPGVPERLERIEYHVGNGDPTPLRRVVTELKAEVEHYHRDERGGG